MTLLFRSAVCASAFIAMGFTVPVAQDDPGANRSGIERVQAEPDGDGPRSNEGRAPGTEADPQPPSGDDGRDGDSDSDAHAPTPAEPPGCVFEERPLELLV